MQGMRETWVRSLGREDPPEKEMETHSSILAGNIPQTEEPSVLQSMGSQRVRHGLATEQQYIVKYPFVHYDFKIWAVSRPTIRSYCVVS